MVNELKMIREEGRVYFQEEKMLMRAVWTQNIYPIMLILPSCSLSICIDSVHFVMPGVINTRTRTHRTIVKIWMPVISRFTFFGVLLRKKEARSRYVMSAKPITLRIICIKYLSLIRLSVNIRKKRTEMNLFWQKNESGMRKKTRPIMYKKVHFLPNVVQFDT